MRAIPTLKDCGYNRVEFAMSIRQWAEDSEAEIKELKVSQKFYFVEGYEYGHNHTVESAYTDAEQVYEDFKQALKK
jgi:hypothetical protein